jgi:hypothetical protein
LGGSGAGTSDIVWALGRDGVTEVRMRALDLREGKEFIEGMLGREEIDGKLSSESSGGGGGSGVLGGGPDLDVEDLIDELEDLTDGTLDEPVMVASTNCCDGCVGSCCCCCCRAATSISEEPLRGMCSVSSPKYTESVPRSEVDAEVGMVLLSDSLSESKSDATGVPRASSSAFTTEIECFRIDFLFFSLVEVPVSPVPFAPGFKLFFSCTWGKHET